MGLRWRAAALLPVAILGACGGTRPLPTLDDYSHETAAPVHALGPLFSEGRPGPELVAKPGALAAVAETAGRFRAAAREAAPPRLRIVDLELETSRRARVDVDLLVTGFARDDERRRVSQAGTFRLLFERDVKEGPWRLVESRATSDAPLQEGRAHLVEEAGARGLANRHGTVDPVEATNVCIPATHHRPGILLVDVDGDLDLDVIAPDRTFRLFLNDGRGLFTDATRGSGLDALAEGEAAGGVAADITGDGLPELFFTNHADPCRMLENLGGGRFADRTASWGLDRLDGPFTSASFLDADRDGFLDLFVAAYGDARHGGPAYSGLNGQGGRFFHQVPRAGHPFFVEATEAAGLRSRGWGFAVSACDYDGDGDDDVYVANDFGVNSLWENRSAPGHPRFADVARAAGAEDEGYGMGVTWGDYDNDGRFDLHVTDYFTPYRWLLRDRRWPLPSMPLVGLVRPFLVKTMMRRTRGDGLYRNLGGRRFERRSEAAGVADGGWAWGTEFVDLDGDGWEDLLVVNGMYRGTTGVDDEIAFWNAMAREGVTFHDGIWGGIDFGDVGMASHTPKKLFLNTRDGRFVDRAFVEGFDTLDDTRGLAFGDLDGDGAPEVALSCFRGPLLLYRNAWGAEGGGRVRVLLSQPDGKNRDALGAVVRLTASGQTQLREVRAGSSYLSQSSRELLFGLGTAPRAESVEVTWPDGTKEIARDVPAGARLAWTRGRTPVDLTREKP